MRPHTYEACPLTDQTHLPGRTSTQQEHEKHIFSFLVILLFTPGAAEAGPLEI